MAKGEIARFFNNPKRICDNVMVCGIFIGGNKHFKFITFFWVFSEVKVTLQDQTYLYCLAVILNILFGLGRCAKIVPLISPSFMCRRIRTHLQQMTFENIVAKGEIAHNKQFLHLPQYFQLCVIIKLPLNVILKNVTGCFRRRLLQICCMWKRVKFSIFEHIL